VQWKITGPDPKLVSEWWVKVMPCQVGMIRGPRKGKKKKCSHKFGPPEWTQSLYPRIRSGAVIFGEWNEIIGWYAGIMFTEFIPCAKQQDI